MNKGFVILAQNTTIDYVKCATTLAKSIKKLMSSSSVTLLTDTMIEESAFDHIILLKPTANDQYKVFNDTQIYELTPYEYTIKLEADMILTQSIDYWWDTLAQRDLVVCSHIRNFKGEISTVRAYRRFIDDNNLPDVYNAITYFRKSITAEHFFSMVENICENWEEYKTLLKCSTTEPVSTDWAYALAAHIIGKEKVLLPSFTQMSMVHMKQHINGMPTENWNDTLVTEIVDGVLRINTYPQRFPFHYHVKDCNLENLHG